ncbi:potassium transporter Kup [Labrys wisconsinensis]|uniref:Probable potassium transport system protein Kup n=1 Tax=Labrys wisconsinensis TaxID=425677 RepID=A0ABU0JLI5_9HYPH|nr:potassium transporter Kup [Labrys wisconsinensis]MDQ0475159.1 KUP system potassium uptake protein [Labrys wisconsinensis]
MGHVTAGTDDLVAEGHHRRGSGFWGLALGSIGVVYGDIGTSPLYAFREALHAATHGGTEMAREAVLGVVSLILWALIVIVTLKYVVLLLRADNKGEGGTLTLMALAQRALGRSGFTLVLLGAVGAAMFYGDAIITPAVSVLSAVEGLELVTPSFAPYVVPLTVAIIVGLFAVQSHGTARVGAFFGPVMVAWFVVIGLLGLVHLADEPGVFAAINPWHAISFMLGHGHIGFVTLGAVFLAVTGAEALYADLGHFGRRPIQIAWLGLVLPSLALNYLGQGALVLKNPAALENPFFLMAPSWALIPMVVLATIATIIASQAVITGAYSLTRQAIQLGLLPRMKISHTSEHQSGQIYISQVNTALAIGVILLVLAFESSSRLASAYGIAVTTTMVVTAVMAYIVIWKVWRWSPLTAALVITPFLLIDLAFLAANLLKVVDGGWVPLMIALVLMLIMITWRRGTRIVLDKTRKTEVPLMTIVNSLETGSAARVPGTAIFLTSDPDYAPTALLHSLKHYKALHKKVAILTIKVEDDPVVADADRIAMERVSDSFTRVRVAFGYMEDPNVPKALALCRKAGWTFDIMSTSFFLSRRHMRGGKTPLMPLWQRKLYMILARNADDASDYFSIPSNRVVEIGTQVLI